MQLEKNLGSSLYIDCKKVWVIGVKPKFLLASMGEWMAITKANVWVQAHVQLGEFVSGVLTIIIFVYTITNFSFVIGTVAIQTDTLACV